MTPDSIVVRSRALQNIIGLGVGVATFLANPTAANLAAMGSLTSPTIVTPAITTSVTLTRNAIGATALSPVAGFTQSNTTAAALGAQQFGPATIHTAQGWDTVASASKSVDFAAQGEAVQAAGNPTGIYRWMARQNGGSWVSCATLSSAGVLLTAGQIAAGSSLVSTTTITAGTGLTVTTGNIAASAGFVQAARNGIGGTSTTNNSSIAFSATNGTAAALGAQQWSPMLNFRGSQWNTTSGASDTIDWYAEVQTVQGTDNNSSNLVFSRSNAGGTKTTILTLQNSGQLLALGSINGTNGTFSNAVTAGVGITATTSNIQASAGFFNGIRAGITTTNTVGCAVRNTTLSTVGTTVQQSPDYEWVSHAWNSVGAVDEANTARAYLLPATAAGTTSSTWRLQFDVAGGGYATGMSCTSGGNFSATTNITAGAAITAGTSIVATAGTITTSNNSITASRSSIGAASTLGIRAQCTTAALVGAQHQWGPYYECAGRVWDGAASQTASWKHEVQTTSGASYRGDYVFTYTDGGGALEYMRMMGRTPGLTIGSATAIPAGGTAGLGLMGTSTANFGVFFGSGAPTLSAAKGSLYLRSDGTGIADRVYVNTNGATTWTNLVTAA